MNKQIYKWRLFSAASLISMHSLRYKCFVNLTWTLNRFVHLFDKRCFFFSFLGRILPKCQWRSVWVSLPNQQLLSKRYVSTLGLRLWILFCNFTHYKSCKWLVNGSVFLRCFQRQLVLRRQYTILLLWRQPRKLQRKPLRRSRWEGKQRKG